MTEVRQLFVAAVNLVLVALYGKILTQDKQQSIIYISKLV
jgi:hypothetical protein